MIWVMGMHDVHDALAQVTLPYMLKVALLPNSWHLSIFSSSETRACSTLRAPACFDMSGNQRARFKLGCLFEEKRWGKTRVAIGRLNWGLFLSVICNLYLERDGSKSALCEEVAGTTDAAQLHHTK
eukprot:1158161-Pelagomonas_calceolata.AAC.1